MGKKIKILMPKHNYIRDANGKAIRKESEGSYQREKRMKELTKRGYSSFGIRYMMGHKDVSEKEVKRAARNPHIKIDGNL